MSKPTKLIAGGLLLALGCLAGWFVPSFFSSSSPNLRDANLMDSGSAVSTAARLESARPPIDSDQPVEESRDFRLPTDAATRAGAPTNPSAGSPNPNAPPEPSEISIDKPEGDYVIAGLDEKGSTRLRGKVNVLMVGHIEGGATLDAAQLEAHQIIIQGNIDGGSIVRLNCPGGSVKFRGKVDGRSWMEVYAPGGSVSFDGPPGTDYNNPSGPDDVGSAIQGDSHVSIHAKEVRIDDISGAETHVLVTLTTGGRLRFVKLGDTARLELHKANPNDPAPTIEAGKINGKAEFKKSD